MRVRRQFVIQVGGGIANLLLLVTLTPLLIKSLGMETYGILLFILGISIYVNAAEFGLGMATTQRIAAARSNEERGAILNTALILSLCFGAAAGALFACLALPGIGQILGLPTTLAHQLGAAWPGLFFIGVGTVIALVAQGALLGLSKFIILNAAVNINTAAAILAPAAYSSFGHDLPGLLMSIAAARFLAVSVAIFACYQGSPITLSLSFDIEAVRPLLSYGGWSTLNGLLHRATNSIDRPLLGAISGPVSIPLFAIPQGVWNRSSVVVLAMASVVFPRLSMYTKSGQSQECDRILNSCYHCVCLLTPFYISGILLTPAVLSVWLGPDFSLAASAVAVLLALASWVDAAGTVPYVMLQATSNLRKDARIAVYLLLPNICLLISAALFFGVVGVAFVSTIRGSAFLLGRLILTDWRGFPSLDIVAQAGCLIGSALLMFVVPDGYVRWAIGGAIVISSCAFVAIRGFRTLMPLRKPVVADGIVRNL